MPAQVSGDYVYRNSTSIMALKANVAFAAWPLKDVCWSLVPFLLITLRRVFKVTRLTPFNFFPLLVPFLVSSCLPMPAISNSTWERWLKPCHQASSLSKLTMAVCAALKRLHSVWKISSKARTWARLLFLCSNHDPDCNLSLEAEQSL